MAKYVFHCEPILRALPDWLGIEEATWQFYLALGFWPLEEFPTLWGEANPCLQLIKHLG